jgi:hypothetical protein
MLAACGGGGGSSPATPPAAPATTLSLSGGGDGAVAGGAAVALTATPSDGSTVSWALGAGSPGKLSASSGASVNYLPPADGVGADTQVTITATANGVSKSITLTLRPAQARLAFLAGDFGAIGRIDGTGEQARLGLIQAGALDASGNLYLTEDRPVIRKITPGGVVTTPAAMAAASGYVDGAAGTARIGRAVCPAAVGTALYFVDDEARGNGDSHELPIRKLDSDGGISTVAKITVSNFDYLCLASDGDKLYAYQSQRISTVTTAGAVATLAGTVDGGAAVDGKGAAARFNGIVHLTSDGHGALYVNDANAVIRKVGADGVTSTLAGAYPAQPNGGAVPQVDGAGAAARFSQLRELVYSDDKLIAYDTYQTGPVVETRLRSITTAGVVSSSAPVQQIAGTLLAGPGKLIYALRHGQVDILNADGGSSVFAGKALANTYIDVDGAGGAARFSGGLSGMGVDGAGNLYVGDYSPGSLHTSPTGLSLRKVTPAGVVSTIQHSAQVRAVTGLLADAAGNVYVSTWDPNRVYAGFPQGGMLYKIAPDGATTALAGDLSIGGVLDGAGAAARFNKPSLIGRDEAGNLFVNDQEENGVVRIRQISPAGLVTTVAAPPAGLGQVRDAGGNVYSIDAAEGLVRRTTPAGVSSIVVGTPGENFNYPGALPGHISRVVALVQTGPYTLAAAAGGAILTIYLPH